MNEFSVGGSSGVSNLQGIELDKIDINQAKQDPHYASSISISDLEKVAINLAADNPQIMFFTPSGLYDTLSISTENLEELNALMLVVSERRSEIIDDMLDAWNESIQEQNELKRDQEKKEGILQGYLQWSALQSPNERIEQVDTQSIEIITHVRDSGNYQEYLRSLPIPERSEELRTTANYIAENYLEKRNPGAQNDDLAKAALGALLVQALVITPMAQQLVIAPVEQSSLSSQIAVKPVIEQNVIPASAVMQQELMPAINFFAMELARDVTVMMYVKQQGQPKKENMIEFANNIAVAALERTKNTEAVIAMLVEKIPDARHMSTQQLENAAKLSQLFMLANALMLFVKAEGGAHLQENELQQLLSGQGIPEGDIREKVVARMNEILQSVPAEKRVAVAESLLKYVGSEPDIDSLTDFFSVLLSAMQEVSQAERSVLRPID